MDPLKIARIEKLVFETETEADTVHVNGPYCITFGWREGDAWRIDLENYH